MYPSCVGVNPCGPSLRGQLPETPNLPAKCMRDGPRQEHRDRRPNPESGRWWHGPQRVSPASATP